jgi:hypothetical protein
MSISENGVEPKNIFSYNINMISDTFTNENKSYENNTSSDSYYQNIFDITTNENIDIPYNTFLFYVKNIIVQEYSLRTEIIKNLQDNCIRLNNIHIIHTKLKHKYQEKISELCPKINITYNKILNSYKTDSYYIYNYEKNYIINNINDTIILNSIQKHIRNYYKDIDDSILYIMNKIGSTDIQDIIKLTNGPNINSYLPINKDLMYLKNISKLNKNTWTLQELTKEIHNSTALLSILTKYFVPIEMHTVKSKSSEVDNNVILIKKYDCDNDDSINDTSEEFKFEILLQNSYKISIKLQNFDKWFVVYGYFNYDPSNTVVLSSQINNYFIFLRKKLLIKYVKSHCNINEEYLDVYLLNLNLGEILSLKENELINQIEEEYTIYSRSCNIKYTSIIKQFIKENLKEKFILIKSLLLGPKKTTKLGAMIWTSTKDELHDNKSKSCVADIIYRNLNYSQQITLKETGKYVKHELNRIKSMTVNDIDLKEQCIMNNNMNDYIKKIVLNRLEEMKESKNEYQKNKTYVETLLNYPWISNNYTDMFTNIGRDPIKTKQKLIEIKEKFDKRVYGQKDFKNIIEELVGKWFSNPNSIGKAIGLVGPPGVGKTLIASGLGKVLDIPYCEFHLGGVDDGSVLNGHSFTYSAAEPGLIVKKMTIAGEPRCILFFDELDKTCAKHGINEIFNVLIHATDPNTNDKFTDKFFGELEFPLSKCIFIFSFNDANKVDPILKDRMEIIEVSPYEISDKIIIAKDFLVPEVSKSFGLEEGSITFTPQTLEYIISNYTFEAGVRGLKNIIDKIFSKLNLDKIHGRGLFTKNKIFSKKNFLSEYLKLLSKNILAILNLILKKFIFHITLEL